MSARPREVIPQSRILVAQRSEAHLTNRVRRSILTTAADLKGAGSAWELGVMTTSQTAMDLTADRRRSTGESHQALHRLLPEDGSPVPIPDAAHVEQAELEAELFLALGAMGGWSVHPMGVVRLRPEPGQLTLQLLHEPYVAWLWADRILPRINEGSAHPLDGVTGIPGLRWRVAGQCVHLFRPGMATRVILAGLNLRWWQHITRRMATEYPTLVASQAPWTQAESAAYEAPVPNSHQSAILFSPLLRRLRATVGPQAVNSTDAWSAGTSWRLEATDGPPCPDLVRLLGHGSTGIGWTVEHKRCTCLCDHEHDTCTIDFRDPATGACIHYSNSRWRRTLTPARLQRKSDLNAAALA